MSIFSQITMILLNMKLYIIKKINNDVNMDNKINTVSDLGNEILTDNSGQNIGEIRRNSVNDYSKI